MMAQNVPLPPPLRGSTYGGYPVQQQLHPPPSPPADADAGSHANADHGPLRNYEPQELALRRADPVWLAAYNRASMQADCDIGFSNEWN